MIFLEIQTSLLTNNRKFFLVILSKKKLVKSIYKEFFLSTYLAVTIDINLHFFMYNIKLYNLIFSVIKSIRYII